MSKNTIGIAADCKLKYSEVKGQCMLRLDKLLY